MMESQLKIALIGFGRWGQLICRELLSLGSDVTVVDCDEACSKTVLNLGANWCPMISQLPAQDGIVVATPAATHLRLVQQLDHHGNQAPVFCEKPLTDSRVEAQQFSIRTGPPIFMMHVWRYHAGLRLMKQMLDEGSIGQLRMIKTVRANWTSPRTDVDCLADLAWHDLSIFQMLLGRIPQTRYAIPEFANEQLVGCIGEFGGAGDPTCVFEISNRYGEKRREIRLHADDGVLVLPCDAGPIQRVCSAGEIIPDQIETIDFSNDPPLTGELSAFLDFVRTGDSTELCPLQDGIDIVIKLDELRKIAFSNQ